MACVLPLLGLASSYRVGDRRCIVVQSMAHCAGHHAVAGVHGRGDVERRRGSFGVGYGLYNIAWGAACSAARRSAASCSNAWASPAVADRGRRC